jgi:hypothetical protein
MVQSTCGLEANWQPSRSKVEASWQPSTSQLEARRQQAGTYFTAGEKNECVVFFQTNSR